jgi:Fe2+ transport system protein FeoA
MLSQLVGGWHKKLESGGCKFMKKKVSDMKLGEKGTVEKIPGSLRNYLAGMGLRLNKNVELSSKQPMNGPIVVTVGNSSISISRNNAEKIIVEVDSR